MVMAKSFHWFSVLCVLLQLLLQSDGQPAAFNSSALPDMPATEIVEMLCSREITARDYVESLLERFEAGGFECMNMFITFNASQVLEDAMAIDERAEAGEDIRPLCGMPLAVKDAIDVIGYPTTAATPALQDAYPQRNPPLIQAYLDANGIIMGKTNLGEMSSSITSLNPHTNGIKTPLNAYDPTRIAGGSSGGSASSVAARIAPFSLCEDTAGSCRSPALANGIYGLRPTLGAYNISDGVVPAYGITRDTIGPFGRTASDMILLDSIVRKPNCTTTSMGALDEPISCEAEITRNLNVSGLRLGLPSTFGWARGLSTEIADVVNNALDKMREAGIELVPFDSAPLDAAWSLAWGGVQRRGREYETSDTTSRYLYRHNYTLSLPEMYYQINRPDTRAFYISSLKAYGDTVAGSDMNWVDYLKTSRPNITKFWIDTVAENGFDALLYPGFRTEISKIDTGDNFQVFTNSSGSFLLPYRSLTYFELDAQAGMTVGAFPVGLDATGTPAGLQIGGPPGSDGAIMSMMLAFEGLLGDMPPPPQVAGCSGCIANVTNVQANYESGPLNVGFVDIGYQPNDTSVWTNFALTFGEGSCYDNALNTYGQDGPLGAGAVPNVAGPISTVQNVTVSSAG